MSVSIRPLTTQDAADIGWLYDQSADHHRSLGDDTDFQFSAEIYQRDGFGENPAFKGIGAVLDGQLVGYLLYAARRGTRTGLWSARAAEATHRAPNVR